MHEAVEHSLLGTVVRLSIGTGRFRSPRRVSTRVFDEMRRLSGVFNIHEATTAISRLRATGGTDDVELLTLLALAERWWQGTDHLFDPAPGHDELPWSICGERVVFRGDCGSVDLNAIAKGWIVDRAAATATRTTELIIDAGGDVLHRGNRSVRVGIEDPAQPYDNVAPKCTIELCDAAVATSGPARRGPHLRDPSTGVAPTAVLSASVVANDAATADVLATALAVTSPERGFAIAERHGVAAMVVDATGGVHTNPPWVRLERSVS